MGAHWSVRKAQKRELACCGCLLLPAVVLVGWLLWSAVRPVGWGNEPFNQAAWQGHSPAEPQRGEMVRSLLRHHRLKGMPAPEVLRLLGPPDAAWGPERAWVPRPQAAAARLATLRYDLGERPVGRYDLLHASAQAEALILSIGPEGSVRTWDIEAAEGD